MATVWTIQTLPAWEKFQRAGILVGDKDYIEPDYLNAYEWMRSQMKERLTAYQNGWPIWVWVRWDVDSLRPDLRTRNHLPTGIQGVRLELAVPEEHVLISDFELWHFVLLNHYLEFNEAESDFWYDRAATGQIPQAVLQAEKEKSWERIFDFNSPRDPEWISSVETTSLQGCIESIRLDQVRKVTRFTAR